MGPDHILLMVYDLFRLLPNSHPGSISHYLLLCDRYGRKRNQTSRAATAVAGAIYGRRCLGRVLDQPRWYLPAFWRVGKLNIGN